MKEPIIRRLASCALAAIAGTFVVSSCSLVPQVAPPELEEIVKRDGVAFDPGSIPEVVLARLASHRVVLVGEVHFLREHRELMTELLRKLHARGFRQLLFEWTQAVDWLMDDFVLDGGLEPDWSPPADIGGAMIAAIRDFNRTLPGNQRIRVRPIDVTLQDYGGDQAFLWSLGTLVRHLSDPGPLSAFLQVKYDKLKGRTAAIEALLTKLQARRSELVASWGSPRYDTVVEMVEVELASANIRAIRESDYDRSVRLREDMMKRLVDRRLGEDPSHGTVINLGSTHAQKQRLWGTKIEWLGDYLIHRSPAAEGSVIAVAIAAARIIAAPDSGIPDQNLETSPKNEILRVIHRTWPHQLVFLPMDDPVFTSRGVPISREGDVYVGSLKRHFDAFVLLPVAHRVPIGQ